MPLANMLNEVTFREIHLLSSENARNDGIEKYFSKRII